MLGSVRPSLGSRRHSDAAENRAPAVSSGVNSAAVPSDRVSDGDDARARECGLRRRATAARDVGRRDERDQADHTGELDEDTESEDDAGRGVVLARREHDRGQQRDADDDVVATTVDEIERHDRVEGEERDRAGRASAPPDDHARGRKCRRREPLVEEAGRQHGGAEREGREAGDSGEQWAVHRRHVRPAATGPVEQRVVRERRGHVCVRARVVHRDDAPVDRVPPEVTGRARHHQQRHRSLRDHDRAHELDRQRRAAVLRDRHRHERRTAGEHEPDERGVAELFVEADHERHRGRRDHECRRREPSVPIHAVRLGASR